MFTCVHYSFPLLLAVFCSKFLHFSIVLFQDNKLKTGAYPFIEYCHDSTLHFLVPCLDNQRFFVPEFCEENKQFAAEKYSDLVKH